MDWVNEQSRTVVRTGKEGRRAGRQEGRRAEIDGGGVGRCVREFGPPLRHMCQGKTQSTQRVEKISVFK